MSLADLLDVHKGVVEHLVTTFTVESDPKAYVDAFDKLTVWVDNSLDMLRVGMESMHHYAMQATCSHDPLLLNQATVPCPAPQGELSKILYPVFLHCYLTLVSKDAATMATSLLAKCVSARHAHTSTHADDGLCCTLAVESWPFLICTGCLACHI